MKVIQINFLDIKKGNIPKVFYIRKKKTLETGTQKMDGKKGFLGMQIV